MPYTNIGKPTGSSYTNVNPLGKENFDDTLITFDQATVFFDSTNAAIWTNVARPTQPFGLNIGMTMGLLIPLTSSQDVRTSDPWTRVIKPT